VDERTAAAKIMPIKAVKDYLYKSNHFFDLYFYNLDNYTKIIDEKPIQLIKIILKFDQSANRL